jgi:signal transduction histidine kinase
MSLLAIVVLVVVAWLCIVVLVMSLLLASKRADADAEDAHRRLARGRERRDERRRIAESERPEEISARRAG